MAKELKLLLPGPGEPEALAGLHWNLKKVVYVTKLAGFDYFTKLDGYIYFKPLGDGEAGQMLILSSNGRYEYPLSLQINNSRYTLISVIARCSDQNRRLLFHSSFKVCKEGFTFNGIDYIPFVKDDFTFCFRDSDLMRSTSKLPSALASNIGIIRVDYDYAIYKCNGPLQSPFDIKQLRYLSDIHVRSEVLKRFDHKVLDERMMQQAVCLIRFIHIWEAVQGKESQFGNIQLEEMRLQIRDLANNVKVEKVQTIETLTMAIKFLQPHYEDYFTRPYPFLSILKAEEPTMWNVRFLHENNPFYDESKNYENNNDGLIEELFFYIPSRNLEEGLPSTVTMGFEKVPLELIAAFSDGGDRVYTFGTGYDDANGDTIFQMACYSDPSPVKIINTPHRGIPSSITKIEANLLYIFRLAKAGRFEKTKNAAKQ